MIWRFVVLVALVAVATAAASSPRDPNDACQACRAFVSFSRKLNSTTQRQDYKNVIEKFCEQYYPPSTDYQTGPCPMFSDGFFFLLDSIDPVYHCDDIGACGKSVELPSDDIYEYRRQANTGGGKLGDPALCTFCEGLVSQIKATLTNPAAVAKLKADSKAFCSYLAVINEDKTCTEVVTKYLDMAILFINRLEPGRYCRDLNMCPRKARQASQRQLPTLADFNNFGLETSVAIGSRPMTKSNGGPDGECVLCKTIVKEMFKFIRENKTEASIIEGLDKVCQLIYPGHGQGYDQCRGLVKAYTRELVEMLIDETDPDMICSILGMCVYERAAPVTVSPSKMRSTPPKTTEPTVNMDANLGTLISSIDPKIKALSPRSCVECKMFIAYLKTVLEDPKSEEEVRQWLDGNLCEIMPQGSLRETCSNMVESYSEIFFKVVAGKLSPQAACIELHACKSRSPVQVLNLNNLNQYDSSPVERHASNTRRCDRCAKILERIDEHLSTSPASHDMSELPLVCNYFAGSLIRRECNNIIERNGLDLIQMVPDMDSPRKACSQLGLC